MITLNFSPVRADKKTHVSLKGSTLFVNGAPFDLSLVNDGDSVTHEVLRKVERTGDDYEITVRLNHGKNAPRATRFPEPIVIEDGFHLGYDYGQ